MDNIIMKVFCLADGWLIVYDAEVIVGMGFFPTFDFFGRFEA